MRQQLEKARQKVLKAASLTLDAQRILTPMGGSQDVQEASTLLLKVASGLEVMRDKVVEMAVVSKREEA